MEKVNEMQVNLETLLSQFEKGKTKLIEEMKDLELRKTRAVEDLKEMNDQIVELDIGGTRFKTTICTLRKVPHTLFDTIFEKKFEDIEKQADGSIYIDRDGTNFSHILNFLRHPDETILLPKEEFIRHSLLKEAEYYKIDALIDFLDKKAKDIGAKWWPNKITMNYDL